MTCMKILFSESKIKSMDTRLKNLGYDVMRAWDISLTAVILEESTWGAMILVVLRINKKRKENGYSTKNLEYYEFRCKALA